MFSIPHVNKTSELLVAANMMSTSHCQFDMTMTQFEILRTNVLPPHKRLFVALNIYNLDVVGTRNKTNKVSVQMVKRCSANNILITRIEKNCGICSKTPVLNYRSFHSCGL